METPRISDAEWEIMNFVWDHSPCSAQEIADALVKSGRTASTVKVLLNRLHSKGALRFEKVGKCYLYRPAVAAEQLRTEATASFLERVFDGELSPMIAHVARSRKLTKRELDELEQILRTGRR